MKYSPIDMRNVRINILGPNIFLDSSNLDWLNHENAPVNFMDYSACNYQSIKLFQFHGLMTILLSPNCPRTVLYRNQTNFNERTVKRY